MRLKNLIYKTKCDNGNCKNYADFVIDRDDTPQNNKLYLCKDCLKEVYQLTKYMFERYDFDKANDIGWAEAVIKDVDYQNKVAICCHKTANHELAVDDKHNVAICCHETANNDLGDSCFENASVENIERPNKNFVGVKKIVQIASAKKKTAKGYKTKNKNEKNGQGGKAASSLMPKKSICNDKTTREKVGN